MKSEWEFLRSNGWHQDEDADWCLFRTNMKPLMARSTREAVEMQLRTLGDSIGRDIGCLLLPVPTERLVHSGRLTASGWWHQRDDGDVVMRLLCQ